MPLGEWLMVGWAQEHPQPIPGMRPGLRLAGRTAVGHPDRTVAGIPPPPVAASGRLRHVARTTVSPGAH